MSQEELEGIVDIDPIQDSIVDDNEYEEDLDEESISIGQDYSAPKVIEQFVDTSKGTVIDKTKLSHYEILKITREKSGLKTLKPNSGCKKCYGRGYTSLNSDGSPNQCNCILPKLTPIERKRQFDLETLQQLFQTQRDDKRLKDLLRDGTLKIENNTLVRTK